MALKGMEFVRDLNPRGETTRDTALGLEQRELTSVFETGAGFVRFLKPIEVYHTTPEVRYTESDQTDPAGQWRHRLITDAFKLQRSTSASWGGTVDIQNLDATGNAFIYTTLDNNDYLEIQAQGGASFTVYGSTHASASKSLLSSPGGFNFTTGGSAGVTWAGVSSFTVQIDTDFTIATTNATGDTVLVGADIQRNTTGTPAAGIGVAITLSAETSAATRIAGRLEATWQVIADGSRASQVDIYAKRGADSGLVSYFRADANNDQAILRTNNTTRVTVTTTSMQLNSIFAELDEIAAPAAPGADKARLYVDVSGVKSRLMVVFQSGAAQQLAIEP